MTRILAVADEVEQSLYGRASNDLNPDVIVACGDLPFDYLEYLVTVHNVPLLYVPGNHDPDLRRKDAEAAGIDLARPFTFGREEQTGPRGCINVDGRVEEAAGLRIAGLGGCRRYTTGPNQYTQRQMRARALRLELRALVTIGGRRGIDLLLTHAPPRGVGDDDDPCHEGFAAFHGAVNRLKPRLLVHGHVHPYGQKMEDRSLNGTTVVNAVASRVIEL